MRKLLSKYKQFIAGVAVGAAAIVGLFLLDASGSEPFQTVPYVIRDVKGDTLFKTPKFTILYRGVGGVNAGSSMTMAGKNRGISSLWTGGYVSNWGGSDKGIENIALYDDYQGIASFFVAGQLFQISNNASQLRVANSVVPLGNSPFVIVEKDQRARIANGSEVKTLLASVDSNNLEYYSAAAPKP
jgi:hypothetical protein